MTLLVARFSAYGATLDTFRHVARIFAERNVVGSALSVRHPSLLSPFLRPDLHPRPPRGAAAVTFPTLPFVSPFASLSLAPCTSTESSNRSLGWTHSTGPVALIAARSDPVTMLVRAEEPTEVRHHDDISRLTNKLVSKLQS